MAKHDFGILQSAPEKGERFDIAYYGICRGKPDGCNREQKAGVPAKAELYPK